MIGSAFYNLGILKIHELAVITLSGFLCAGRFDVILKHIRYNVLLEKGILEVQQSIAKDLLVCFGYCYDQTMGKDDFKVTMFCDIRYNSIPLMKY